MMTELKRLTSKIKSIELPTSDAGAQAAGPRAEPPGVAVHLTIRDGWNFGIGFFVAAFIFTFIIVPAIACSALILISLLGISLSG